MRVLDRVADVGEPPQELAQPERPPAGVSPHRLDGMESIDGLLKRVATDEPHSVERPAVRVRAQAVDRDDSRVLQPAGDLGLEHEAGAAGWVVGVLLEDLLERHLAVQLGVQGDEDGAQAAAGVRPQDSEPLAVAGGLPDRIACCAVGVIALGRGGGDLGEGTAEVGVVNPGQALAGGAPGGEGGQALPHIAAVHLQVQTDHGLDAGALVRVEVAAGGEMVGQRPVLVERPGLEGSDELDLANQAVLQGQQAEEQVTFGGDGGHEAGLLESRRWR